MSHKKSITVVVVAGIVFAATAAGVIYFTDAKTIVDNKGENYLIKERWIISGPFAINKASHLLGENIFIVVSDLAPEEKGNIIFLRPDGGVHRTIPFDGSLKQDFNHYFTPKLSRALKACDIDDLVGTWNVVFQGVPYKPITFQIVNEFLLGEEKYYESKC